MYQTRHRGSGHKGDRVGFHQAAYRTDCGDGRNCPGSQPYGGKEQGCHSK